MMIRSRKVLDSSRGQTCTLALPGICNHNPETTVWAHLNGHAFGKGMGIKAHDIHGFHACSDCHNYYDRGHGTKKLMTDADLLWAVLGAVTTTWVRLISAGIVTVPQDKPKAAKVAMRKPKAERVRVQSNPNHKWPSRPMQSRNDLRRKEPQ